MTSKNITIAAPNGLHARPVSELAKLAKAQTAKVSISTPAKTVNAASMLGVLSLGLKKGTEITISAEGENEAEAVQVVADFIASVQD